jgi:hypothetical protein
VGVLVASLTKVIVPGKLPALVGANVISKLALCPAAMVVGNVIPLIV